MWATHLASDHMAITHVQIGDDDCNRFKRKRMCSSLFLWMHMHLKHEKEAKALRVWPNSHIGICMDEEPNLAQASQRVQGIPSPRSSTRRNLNIKFKCCDETCMKEMPNGDDFSIDCYRLFKQLLWASINSTMLNARYASLFQWTEGGLSVSCWYQHYFFIFLFSNFDKRRWGHEETNSPLRERGRETHLWTKHTSFIPWPCVCDSVTLPSSVVLCSLSREQEWIQWRRDLIRPSTPIKTLVLMPPSK